MTYVYLIENTELNLLQRTRVGTRSTTVAVRDFKDQLCAARWAPEARDTKSLASQSVLAGDDGTQENRAVEKLK